MLEVHVTVRDRGHTLLFSFHEVTNNRITQVALGADSATHDVIEGIWEAVHMNFAKAEVSA